MSDVALVGVNLFFSSKFTEPAKALGLSVDATGADENLPGAKVVFVDLERTPPERIAAIRAATKAHLVGFGSHGALEVLEAARQAGCDEVLSRGELSAQLPKLLQRFAP